MAPTDIDDLRDLPRGNWVRLRTLVAIRWVAIAGQMAALAAGHVLIGLDMPVLPAIGVIAMSVVANVFSLFVYPGNKRLSEREALLMLMFDLLQLGLLLFLTGGLNNPFSVLILTPVTIAATVLHLRSTVLLGSVAIILISGLLQNHLPLLIDGKELALPVLLQVGFWVALMIGAVFLSVYARIITSEMQDMDEALLATQMALAREQKLTDLGGVIAAAAHELGTPLATIKLVSGELLADSTDSADLHDDLMLIREQADRCRDILLSMGRAGKDDLHLRRAPLQTVIREAADPHLSRGKDVRMTIAQGDGREPVINRRPEIIHGLRNLIQNAVDFADATVELGTIWTDRTISLRIADDGPGFPPSVIGRIGDPFVRRRRDGEDRARRPGYEGMGLGLFIAKTLLERSGATLTFSNGGAQLLSGKTGGAVVLVSWPRARIEVPPAEESAALGQNRPFA
ncbi:MAG: ActS/PrrB/RegB family redox-sensitive histidine kinase [Limimaricola sp.]|uniref:sensor histidine kinase RegB n=1 Tax=Limimaricola sp. TaxID=2211665 RepID=UPI001D274499|nr:ActS/PrrB/RegB family redox-sensitive histidine kinase [Limimaricola sp.]MBI1417240.1 ActS/PrrB/RegB family redox-sensitive histidine kinase [Limimaricola sp.]